MSFSLHVGGTVVPVPEFGLNHNVLFYVMRPYDYNVDKYFVNFGFEQNIYVRSFIIMNHQYTFIFVLSRFQCPNSILIYHECLAETCDKFRD